MNSITLYVDSISDDLTIAETINPKNIAYNNSKLGSEYVEGFTDLIKENGIGLSIGFTGRYIVTVEVILDTKTYKMRFIDLQQNEDKAQEYLKKINSDEGKKIFIEVCRDHEKFYLKEYDYTSLVVGVAPL